MFNIRIIGKSLLSIDLEDEDLFIDNELLLTVDEAKEVLFELEENIAEIKRFLDKHGT